MLTTSFNVELVFIILKSMTLFNKEELNIANSKIKSRTKIIRRIDKSMFVLEKIKIKDPDVWNVLSNVD